MDNRQVEHSGIVSAVAPGRVTVTILSHTACSACHAKGACTMADSSAKRIDAVPTEGSVFAVGERVKVTVSHRTTREAVALAYGIPAALLVGSLAAAVGLGASEPQSALIALGTTVAYFAGLVLLRRKMEKRISIGIEKTNDTNNDNLLDKEG